MIVISPRKDSRSCFRPLERDAGVGALADVANRLLTPLVYSSRPVHGFGAAHVGDLVVGARRQQFGRYRAVNGAGVLVEPFVGHMTSFLRAVQPPVTEPTQQVVTRFGSHG